MRIGDFSEDEYLEMIEEGMDAAIDRVASWEEWLSLKRAALRWLEKTEEDVRRGLDDAAVEQEHDPDA